MTESLDKLEQQRSSIFQEMSRLPDFRPGSITTTRGTCGKPNSLSPAPSPGTRSLRSGARRTLKSHTPSVPGVAREKHDVL
jgi:hypothetical protein